MRIRAAAALVLVCGLGTAGAQDKGDKGLTRADIDKRAALAAYDAAVVGTDLFNNAKDFESCYRLYQGTLMGLLPMLDHNPKLTASIKDKLDKAKRMRPIDGAFVLRDALEEVQDLNRAKKPLWDRLGGELRVRAVVNDFLVAIANDPKVNVTRDGKYPLDAKGVARLSQLLVEQISSATGGPLKYTGRDMKKTHAGMKITEAEFNAAAVHLVDVLVRAKVPEAERGELLGVIASTKNDIVEVKGDPATDKPGEKTTLWDRLGGEKAVRAVVHDFVAAAAGDPKVNFTRDGKYKLDAEDVKKLEQLLVEQISSATGGPLKYTGRDMKKTHAGMKITTAEFKALAGHLVATLNKYNVPQREITELVELIGSTANDIVEEK